MMNRHTFNEHSQLHQHTLRRDNHKITTLRLNTCTEHIHESSSMTLINESNTNKYTTKITTLYLWLGLALESVPNTLTESGNNGHKPGLNENDGFPSKILNVGFLSRILNDGDPSKMLNDEYPLRFLNDA